MEDNINSGIVCKVSLLFGCPTKLANIYIKPKLTLLQIDCKHQISMCSVVVMQLCDLHLYYKIPVKEVSTNSININNQLRMQQRLSITCNYVNIRKLSQQLIPSLPQLIFHHLQYTESLGCHAEAGNIAAMYLILPGNVMSGSISNYTDGQRLDTGPAVAKLRQSRLPVLVGKCLQSCVSTYN